MLRPTVYEWILECANRKDIKVLQYVRLLHFHREFQQYRLDTLELSEGDHSGVSDKNERESEIGLMITATARASSYRENRNQATTFLFRKKKKGPCYGQINVVQEINNYDRIR